MSVIFIKNGMEIDTEICLRGLNLLAHAQMVELSIGSTCGGHGKCGADRLKLSEEAQALVNAPTEIERIHLKESLLKSGFRLGCQVFPEKDGLTIRAIIE